MKLSLILFALGLKLRWSARFGSALRKNLLDVDRLIVIRTRDGRWARSYRFRDGRVTVSGGIHPEATAELVWNDVPVAVAAMLSSKTSHGIAARAGGRALAATGILQCLEST